MWPSTCSRWRGHRCCITLSQEFPCLSLSLSLSLSRSLFPVPQTHIWALISQHSSLRPQHFLQLSTEWKQWLTRRDDERESAWRWDRKKGRLNPSRPQRPSFFFFFFLTHYTLHTLQVSMWGWEAHMLQCVSNQHREESSKSITYVSVQNNFVVRESEACPQIQRQTEMLL